MSKEVVQRRTGSVHFGQDLPLTDWLIALSHDSPFAGPQARAARAGTAPPLTSVPSLLSLLKDSDRNVRLRAITALGDLAEEVRRVLPTLRTALGEAALYEPDHGVRTESVRSLLRAGPQPVTEVGALVDALQSEVDVVRFHATIALGDFGAESRPAVAALIHASLWDEEPAVRVGAAIALWKIDDHKRPLVLHVLTKALGDANELICWVAAECLGQIGPAAREAVPALWQTLQRDFRLSLITKSVKLALERIDPERPDRAK
jgi:HEAT repeat protein